jgi:hypothetical protein
VDVSKRRIFDENVKFSGGVPGVGVLLMFCSDRGFGLGATGGGSLDADVAAENVVDENFEEMGEVAIGDDAVVVVLCPLWPLCRSDSSFRVNEVCEDGIGEEVANGLSSNNGDDGMVDVSPTPLGDKLFETSGRVSSRLGCIFWVYIAGSGEKRRAVSSNSGLKPSHMSSLIVLPVLRNKFAASI